jgi:hypothetical protein
MDCFRALHSKDSTQKIRILHFIDQSADYGQDTSYLKNEKVVFLFSDCISILQLLNPRMITSFKHYYHIQLKTKAILLLFRLKENDTMQTFEKMMDEKFASHVPNREKDDGGKYEPLATFLCRRIVGGVEKGVGGLH